MLLVAVEAIRQRLPGVDVLAQLHKEDFDQGRAVGVTLLEAPPSRAMLRRIIAAINPFGIHYKTGAVIDIGGYQFSDSWGIKSAQNKLAQVKRRIRAGEPVFFMPQAWGPFSSADIGSVISEIVNTATLSFARDKTSLKELQKLAGADNPKVCLAHDIAWNFRGDDPSAGRQIICDAAGTEKERGLTVCVIPNLQVYKRAKGQEAHNEYIVLLCDIISHLCRRHNARLILLENQFSESKPDRKNDRTLSEYIFSLLDGTLPIYHLNKTLSAAQVKSVIANSGLLLSSRYHALIAALSQQVPAVAIGWSHKYDELMTEVGLSANIISSSAAKQDALNQVDAIIANLPQARETLAATVPAIKQSGRAAMEGVLALIADRFREQF